MNMNQNAGTGNIFEHPASFCNAFFVFRQTYSDELKFWTSLSGACKKWKESHHVAPMSMVYHHMHPLATLFLGHIMVNSGKGYNEVDTTNIEADQFSDLSDSSSIVIIGASKKIYNCRVNWC